MRVYCLWYSYSWEICCVMSGEALLLQGAGAAMVVGGATPDLGGGYGYVEALFQLNTVWGWYVRRCCWSVKGGVRWSSGRKVRMLSLGLHQRSMQEPTHMYYSNLSNHQELTYAYV